MKAILCGLGLMVLTSSISSAVVGEVERVDLAGEWRFQLDADKKGVNEKWYGRILEDRVKLPGTTDENQKGVLVNETPIDRLGRVWAWKGAAWYQREVVIPDGWKGKRITLFLERTKNTRVWVDQSFCGRDDTLSAPQIHDLSAVLTPGKHTLTLLVDNSILPPVGPAHAVDERTQTNWNGVVGRMELRATDPVWIEEVQAHPDVRGGQVKVKALLGNKTGMPAEGWLIVHARSVKDPNSYYGKTEIQLKDVADKQAVEFNFRTEKPMPLWDELHPELVELDLWLRTRNEQGAFENRALQRFGMREFTQEKGQLLINGKPVLLRGRLDCANYPLTGYAPMDRASWQRILGILKDWGMNHVRFHSWCPPQAAFDVADEMGFYFQAELPNKRSAFNAADSAEAAVHNIDFLELESSDSKASLYDYGKREGELIFRHYGNSPSFVMFTLGNELGRNAGMFEMVKYFRGIDPRRLYAQGSNNMHWEPSLAEGDDFWVAKSLEKSSRLIRGSDSIFDEGLVPHIDFLSPSTMVDYSKAIEGCPVPAIGHETGQFQVYPDFRDIAKFTGVTRARNYEVFRDRLEAAGMLDQAQRFVDASGILAAICYREDIEAALRTPGFGGFQLLDLQDFPGQGTALVGMLNDFMDNKGFIQPAEWREFCCEVVPLIRMRKYCWMDNETFAGLIQVAHYGAQDVSNGTLSASLSDASGTVLSSRRYEGVNLKAGGLREVGELTCDLSSLKLKTPQRLTLTLTLEGTPYRNRYPLWVYPAKVEAKVPEGVLMTRSFQESATRQHLEQGGSVLLLPPLDALPLS
ncbi:MAG TPA: glycoside hydrolase family 2 TIM barrel-domain containing protein, partial [Luteolibacter sp.]|nr:glycoside hydrolase family 2 TIM barrel-domain containing protein [Luteolibacter sp.]